jgi:hypothetical protein
MIAQNISKIYIRLKAMGMARSKRAFSRHWLKKGRSYIRNLEYTGRLTVPPEVIETLRSRLLEVAKIAPAELATELNELVASLDRDCEVARVLGWA